MARKITFLGFIIFLFLSSLYHAASRFEYKIKDEDVFFVTEGSMFLVQPVSIICSDNMLYFAAQDITAKRDLIVNKTKEVKCIVDQDDRKVVKATYLLADAKSNTVYKDYELVLFLEILKGYPFLAISSKFVYTGNGINECAINWALDSIYEPFKYYTIPVKGKEETHKLVKTKKTKIGQANWIFANRGDGTGGGLIAPAAILGRGEDFIFLNSVPPKKKLKKGESIDLFMIFFSINKNYKIIPTIFEKIKDRKWEY
ncbi:MAG: hypothetical protein NC905_03685 [Candidatus Omnitrophica bacterium]|nr:hypothetical protein [Candidatus Omnitrophota bacterium]